MVQSLFLNTRLHPFNAPNHKKLFSCHIYGIQESMEYFWDTFAVLLAGRLEHFWSTPWSTFGALLEYI